MGSAISESPEKRPTQFQSQSPPPFDYIVKSPHHSQNNDYRHPESCYPISYLHNIEVLRLLTDTDLTSQPPSRSSSIRYVVSLTGSCSQPAMKTNTASETILIKLHLSIFCFRRFLASSISSIKTSIISAICLIYLSSRSAWTSNGFMSGW